MRQKAWRIITAATLLMAMAFVFSACGDSNDAELEAASVEAAPPAAAAPAASALTGHWWYNGDYDIGYGVYNYDVWFNFNADGTGWIEYVWTGDGTIEAIDEFTWSAANGTVTKTFLDGASDTFTYSISGSQLTINEGGHITVLQRG